MGTRVDEHKKEVEELSKAAYTRTKRKISTTEFNKSAISDHGVSQNHVINWDGVRVIDREEDIRKRRIREAIWIKRKQAMMNRDEGVVYLPRVWDNIIAAAPSSGSKQKHRFEDGC